MELEELMSAKLAVEEVMPGRLVRGRSKPGRLAEGGHRILVVLEKEKAFQTMVLSYIEA